MTIWRDPQKLILASQSRARRMLLENAGLDFEALPADIDERGVQTEFRPFGAGRDRLAPGAREGAVRIQAEARLDMSSAPIRRWRWGNGCSASRPAARRLPSSSRLLAGPDP